MKPHYAKYIEGNFGYRRVLDKVKECVYTKIKPLKMQYAKTKEPVLYRDRLNLEYINISEGENWGNVFDCAWFHVTCDVPKEYLNKNIVMVIDLSGEGCVFDKNGNPSRGITNGSSTFDRDLGQPGKRIVKADNYITDGKFEVWIDAGNNDLFGNLCNEGRVKEAFLAECSGSARDLYYDGIVLSELLKVLPEDSARYYSILHTLRRMTYELNSFSEDEFKKARSILKPELERKNGDYPFEVAAVGHSHMDLAWLWPIRETKRKIARTFSTQLEMIEKFPDYVYNVSQPQQLAWTKELYPELYKKMKDAVKSGNIEVQGGTWVENDTNMPCGESIVRQFLYGIEFTEKEFGYKPELLWLPDVFGYSQALPQIAVKSGIKYFSTIKLSWNAVNKFPYNTFYWEGVDKSRLLVHMPPEGTYNSSGSPIAAKSAEKNFAEKGLSNKSLMVFGIGDGGGGAGTYHLERVIREKDLLGIPKVKMQSALSFFQEIDNNQEEFPQFKGELYMENHQGTLTTIAMVKKGNRIAENKLRYAEMLSCFASMANCGNYPKEQLEAIWKEVLLYQFHDILPGSSIKRVYDECSERYDAIFCLLDSIADEAHGKLVERYDDESVYNFSPFAAEAILEKDGKYRKIEVLANSNIVKELPLPDSSIAISKTHMENDLLSVKFNPKNGCIESLIMKDNGFQAVKDGGGMNKFVVYPDLGDSWDMCIDYRNKKKEYLAVEDFHIESDNYEARCVITYKYYDSKINQVLKLKQGVPYVEMENQVDWKEKDKMLRVDFDLAVDNQFVKCDMQFGSYNRTSMNNTSLDYAQFEMCAHKFIDATEKDYGVALLNDCKYGHHADRGLISLNLIRCQGCPGSFADLGKHSFRFAILPHRIEHQDVNVEKHAYHFNNPLIIKNGKAKEMFAAKCDKTNIIVETLKLSQAMDGYVIRAFETSGVKTECELEIGFTFKKAYLTNMIEEKLSQLDVVDRKINIEFGANEIQTILFEK